MILVKVSGEGGMLRYSSIERQSVKARVGMRLSSQILLFADLQELTPR